MNWIDCVENEV